MLNCNESTLSKFNYIVEPIVKISPPTPMRMVPQNHQFTITDDPIENENDAECKNDNIGLTNSNLSDGFGSVNRNGEKDAKLYEISVCMTEFLKNNSVQTKKSCQLHKSAPPLKIFDDNLKRFLPKKKLALKSPSTRVQPMMSSNVLDLSKLHRNKSCPFHRQPILEDRIEFGVTVTENKIKVSPPLRGSKTEVPGRKKVKGNFDQFLRVPESPYVNLRSNSKYQTQDKKSKSKFLTSNLNYMLSIPKLNDVSADENLFKYSDYPSSEEAIANSDYQQEIQAISDEHNTQINFPQDQGLNALELATMYSHSAGSDQKLPKLTNNLKPASINSMNLPDELSIALDEQRKQNGSGVNKNRIGTAKLQDQPEKDFLKVPKLGTISSYPSFSKLTSGDSVEAEESQKPLMEGSTGNIMPRILENPAQQPELCNRDFLKVPKLSMMSSYPSFTSLIPDSLDNDDNAIGASELISKHMDHETSSHISVFSNSKLTQGTSIFTDKLTPLSLSDERSANDNENSDLITTRNKEASVNSSQAEKPKRRQSLKDSVRYAYRALKFITPNKNLDFQPQSYHPPQESCSLTGSSASSHDSKYFQFEPVIKLLTYEDMNKDRPPIRSASSSTYGTVRSRLKQNASHYLGSDYFFSNSKGRPATASTTILSLTRSTSGPTLDFEEPVFERPSEEVLSKLPKMFIFPRRKFDKCFACLHKAFGEPVEYRRELPLATLNAVVKETAPKLSESESSSISLPDVKEFVESQSDYEDNWTDLLRSTKKSSLLDKTEWKSSKGLLRTNVDLYRSRQSFARASEESQSLKSDAKVETLRRNLSTKESLGSNNHPKPLSLSSEHSKPSSLSGHSSESEEPQVHTKPAIPSSECFVSPYAPLYWAPSLDPLKSLKLRKPISMHGRAVSITKTEDDSTSDDNVNDYRSTRKEAKLNNASARKVTDKNQDSINVDSSAKSSTKFGEKSNFTKQPSIVAKIITSQLSTVINLAKKQSKVDILSDDSKNENQTRSVADVGQKIPKEILIESEAMEASLQNNEKQIMNLESNLRSVDHSNQQYVEAQSVGRSVKRSPLPQNTKQLIENGSPTERGNNRNLVADKSIEKPLLNENNTSVSETDISTKFQKRELHPEESQYLAKTINNIYSSERVIEVLETCAKEERTPLEMLEALNVLAHQNDPFTSKETISNPEVARTAEIAKNLIKLLIDSKKYLNPDTFSPHLQFSSQQIPLCNPRQLRRVLPIKTYNFVARILGMPEDPVDKSLDQKRDFEPGHQAKDPFKLRQTRTTGLSDSCDMIVSIIVTVDHLHPVKDI